MYYLTLTFDLLKGSDDVVSTVVTIEDGNLYYLLNMMRLSIEAYGVRFDHSPLLGYAPDVLTNKMALQVFEDALNAKLQASCLCDFIDIDGGYTLFMCGNVKLI